MAAPAEPAPAAPAPAAAAAPAKTWKDLVTVDGLVDAYYQYNFTGANSLVPPGGQRSFDLNSNTFTLSYAKLGVGVAPEPVGLRLDLGYGATGILINAANGADATSDPFLVQQAFVTLAPAPGLTIDFGKFMTTAGAEVIEASKNWIYSRSIAFFNIPLLHTGLRLGYKVSDALTIQASIVNGWNGVGIAPDITKDKTFGVSLAFTAPTGTSIYATGYFGKGETISGATPAASTDTRVVGDLVVAHTMGPLGLNLNFDYVTDKAAGIVNFVGVAVMGRYLVNDSFAIALRGEYAQAGDDDIAPKYKQEEGTLTLAFPMAGRCEVRAELRADFATPDGAFDNGADNNQFTGTAAFLSWF